ncbi:MAG: hypothetical protein M5U12_17220 [Verrucomicrobia bacterium]|nr:hypothetical protein [Verrucomicrobiota bacterium]
MRPALSRSGQTSRSPPREEESDDGKRRLRVAWVNPPRAAKPLEEGFLARLSAKARTLGLCGAERGPGQLDQLPF